MLSPAAPVLRRLRATLPQSGRFGFGPSDWKQVALLSAAWLAPQLSCKSRGLQFEFISAGICMCPQCRSHCNWGLTPVLPGLTQHPHVAERSTETEHLVPESLLLWFFSPELTCQDWLFCDLPANLASPLSGALVLHQTGDMTAWIP